MGLKKGDRVMTLPMARRGTICNLDRDSSTVWINYDGKCDHPDFEKKHPKATCESNHGQHSGSWRGDLESEFTVKGKNMKILLGVGRRLLPRNAHVATSGAALTRRLAEAEAR